MCICETVEHKIMRREAPALIRVNRLLISLRRIPFFVGYDMTILVDDPLENPPEYISRYYGIILTPANAKVTLKVKRMNMH